MLSESEIIPAPLKQLQLIKKSQLNKKIFNHFVMTYEATVQYKIKPRLDFNNCRNQCVISSFILCRNQLFQLVTSLLLP
jgi:hypothetical protein